MTCATPTACDVCKSGFYKDGTGVCKPCTDVNADCVTCTDVSTCTSCKNTFYAEAALCKPCAAGCSRCSGSASCDVCASNCPAGSMYDYTSIKCVPCVQKGCMTC